MSVKKRQLPLDVESEIARIVRTYVDVARGDDSSQQQEALRWLCSGLERLLDGELEGHDGWRGWINGILPAVGIVPEAVKAISAVEVSVRGSAV